MKQKINLTVDAVIFSKSKTDIFVLLILRKNKPFQNQWALPGGFVDNDELITNACVRELEEETGLKITVNQLKFVGVYDEVSRDPRGRTVSIAYTTLIDECIEVTAADDASEAKWINLKDVESDLLAFDHFKIMQEAKPLCKID